MMGERRFIWMGRLSDWEVREEVGVWVAEGVCWVRDLGVSVG